MSTLDLLFPIIMFSLNKQEAAQKACSPLLCPISLSEIGVITLLSLPSFSSLIIYLSFLCSLIISIIEKWQTEGMACGGWGGGVLCPTEARFTKQTVLPRGINAVLSHLWPQWPFHRIVVKFNFWLIIASILFPSSSGTEGHCLAMP